MPHLTEVAVSYLGSRFEVCVFVLISEMLLARQEVPCAASIVRDPAAAISLPFYVLNRTGQKL